MNERDQILRTLQLLLIDLPSLPTNRDNVVPEVVELLPPPSPQKPDFSLHTLSHSAFNWSGLLRDRGVFVCTQACQAATTQFWTMWTISYPAGPAPLFWGMGALFSVCVTAFGAGMMFWPYMQKSCCIRAPLAIQGFCADARFDVCTPKSRPLSRGTSPAHSAVSDASFQVADFIPPTIEVQED